MHHIHDGKKSKWVNLDYFVVLSTQKKKVRRCFSSLMTAQGTIYLSNLA